MGHTCIPRTVGAPNLGVRAVQQIAEEEARRRLEYATTAVVAGARVEAG